MSPADKPTLVTHHPLPYCPSALWKTRLGLFSAVRDDLSPSPTFAPVNRHPNKVGFFRPPGSSLCPSPSLSLISPRCANSSKPKIREKNSLPRLNPRALGCPRMSTNFALSILQCGHAWSLHASRIFFGKAKVPISGR